MANLSLFLLGPPRVELEGRPVEIKRRKVLALLSYLAVTHERQPRETLATLLWPESSHRTARKALRRDLSELNLALEGMWLGADWESVGLRTGFWLDVAQFQHYLAHEADNPQSLTAAAALYRDDFLTGFTLPDCPEFDEWQFYQTESLRQALASALERLVGLLNGQTDHETAIPYARRWLALDPLHEPAHRQLMQLYAQAGRQAAALRQYEVCRQTLADELGISPAPETTRLYADIRTGKLENTGLITPAPSLPRSPAPPRHNLPTQTTTFIGRESELADIKRLLLDETGCRLLNLVGPGGIGKTRLALAAAAQTLDAFPDGVYFVSLAPVSEVEFIVPAIAEALRFTFYAQTDPKAQLLDYLGQKRLLLIVDNFEHLLDGANLLSEILGHAPEVTLLATSRERLNLREEWGYEVQGLPFPAVKDETLNVSKTSEVLTSYSAIQLFLQRARQTEAGFAPSAAEMADIGWICQLVEGMPLGLELAAPWIRTLSCREIAMEIQQNLDFLTTPLQNVPERHRSLRVVFEQTWTRLSVAEQAVLMQLSVFRGGCTREAAEQVTGATLLVLSSLVDKALLRRTNTGRYELHELLRQYLAIELNVAGQVETARDAHCLYYTDFLRQREADLKGRRQVAALDEIEADFENVRTAWLWAVQGRNYDAVGRTLESLYWYCDMRNRYQENLELIRFARENLAPVAGERPHPVWGRVIARVPSPARVYLEPLTEVRERVEISLTIAKEYGNQAELAFCLWRLGLAAFDDNDDITVALAYCKQSLAHYQALDDRFYQAHLLDYTGIWYLRLNQPDRGAKLIQQGADLRRELGDKIGLTFSLGTLGWIAYHSGHYTEAEAHWQEGYQLACETRDRQETALMLMGAAWLTLFNRGDFVAVRALAEEIQTIALAINSREGKRRAQILFGFLAGMSEDYAACRQFMHQAAYRRKFTYNISWMIMGLCLAACGLGEVQTARQHLEQVLDMSRVRGWPAVMAQCLPFAAIIAAKSGEPEQAVELLSLAFHHPFSPKGWLEKWPLLTRLRAELEAALSPAAFATVWERGQTLDLAATVQALLVEDVCPLPEAHACPTG